MAELIMGFDFGTRRIGIAVGQRVTSSANSVGHVRARDGKPDWNAMDKLVGEWQPDLFVVGLPLNMDDTMSEVGEAAMKFARRLQGRYNIPFEMMDERLSTFEARQQEPEDIDGAAASLILTSWLSQ